MRREIVYANWNKRIVREIDYDGNLRRTRYVPEFRNFCSFEWKKFLVDCGTEKSFDTKAKALEFLNNVKL